MYVMYIDESGTPDGWSGGQNHFVLGGVAMHEGEIRTFSQRLDEIQKAYFPDIAVPLAFHAFEISSGKGRFRELTPETRTKLLGDIYGLFRQTAFPYLIAFATAVHVSVVRDPKQVLHDAFQDICQRFNTFLVRQFNRGHKDKGVLIIDQAHEEHYRSLLADFQKRGTDYGYIGNIVDIPYFAGLRDTRLLQFADFCAYAMFRRYERSDVGGFGAVLPRIDRRRPGGPPEGLKHMTMRACTCEACSWR
ncbi:MAG: DUF3800 domain-containing protein [Candidatus Hydrogenedentes bacterium]|nr:DUF3800 domain-containing protein [Candidatus Hydrogenedentota bacterium]